mgnify:CR=1 FL=1
MEAFGLPLSEGKARVGEWVMAIGDPFGLGGTVTTGIISARNRDINAGAVNGLIILGGNPVFDAPSDMFTPRLSRISRIASSVVVTASVSAPTVIASGSITMSSGGIP